MAVNEKKEYFVQGCDALNGEWYDMSRGRAHYEEAKDVMNDMVVNPLKWTELRVIERRTQDLELVNRYV